MNLGSRCSSAAAARGKFTWRTFGAADTLQQYYAQAASSMVTSIYQTNIAAVAYNVKLYTKL